MTSVLIHTTPPASNVDAIPDVEPGLPARRARPASVLSWLAALTATAGDLDLAGIEVELPIHMVTITVGTARAYRDWCLTIGAPAGDPDPDALGAVARSTATVGDWTVTVVAHVPPLPHTPDGPPCGS